MPLVACVFFGGDGVVFLASHSCRRKGAKDSTSSLSNPRDPSAVAESSSVHGACSGCPFGKTRFWSLRKAENAPRSPCASNVRKQTGPREAREVHGSRGPCNNDDIA